MTDSSERQAGEPDSGDEITVDVNLKNLSRDDMRRCFNMSFMSMNKLLNCIAEGADEDELESAVHLCQAAQDRIVSIMRESDAAVEL